MRAALKADPIAEMERLYKKISAECKANPATLEAARQELVKLQGGDEENLRIWREMIALSRVQFDTIYGRLGVKFDHTLGESFYHPRLQPLVEELRAKGIARESEGAMAVFFEDIPQLKEHPALIQKSDGAFNYATTDLATLAHRLETWHPDEIVYVTDARQQLHFQQLFAVFRRWHPEAKVKLAHVWFGSILGEDGKPFKTRSGETVKLADLLDEAEERAFKVVSEKSPELPEAAAARDRPRRRHRRGQIRRPAAQPPERLRLQLGQAAGAERQHRPVPAIRLRPHPQHLPQRQRRTRRLACPSLRITSALQLDAPEELALARHLLNFGLVLEAVADDYRPNFLCNYLYELAGHFTGFLRELPGAQIRGRATRQPPGALRSDGARPETGPGRAGDRDAGADVNPPFSSAASA